MKWDKETGLPVPGTYQSKNRQLERLFLSGMYQDYLGTNPVLGSEISSIVKYSCNSSIPIWQSVTSYTTRSIFWLTASAI